MRTKAPTDHLIPLAQVLAELGGDKPLARSTFDTWRALGTAPPVIKYPNGKLFVRRSALDAWLEARTEAAVGSVR
jgi:hypothetical protein